MRLDGKQGDSIEVYTLKELDDKTENDIKEFLANLEYWKYLPELNVLRHLKRDDYDVDFDQITDDASLCSWIMHINDKQWMEELAVLEFLDFASIYREGYQQNYTPENIKKYL
ncbi:MAG: hypothetical protein EAZ87_20385 [Nostocales cyanobacterium]|jgi:hypothetical protein|nr:MAG: hypothetical protein EAZ87_20385 [Nostocales cyanobacterium]